MSRLHYSLIELGFMLQDMKPSSSPPRLPVLTLSIDIPTFGSTSSRSVTNGQDLQVLTEKIRSDLSISLLDTGVNIVH
jgi:hypothetical protein